MLLDLEMRKAQRHRFVVYMLCRVNDVEEKFGDDLHLAFCIACMSYLQTRKKEPLPTIVNRIFFNEVVPELESIFHSEVERSSVVADFLKVLLEPVFDRRTEYMDREDKIRLREYGLSSSSVN